MKLSAFTKRLIERVATIVVASVMAWLLHRFDVKIDQQKADINDLEWGVSYFQDQ